MWFPEKYDLGRCAGHRGGWCADQWRQRICWTFADRYAETDRNIFVGVFRPGYRFEAGKDLSILIGERATTAGASILEERATEPPALTQSR